MTDSLPTAAEALAAAVAILRAPTSTELSVRKAEIWLGVARELRQAADRRAKLASAAGETAAERFERLKLDADVTGAERKASPEPEAPAPRGPIPPMLDGRLREIRRPADLRFGGPVPTAKPDGHLVVDDAHGRIVERPAISDPRRPGDFGYQPAAPALAQWQIGDRADCAHCHTPIVFVARRMQDPLAPGEGDFSTLWVHKYTDQRVCMTPNTGDTMTDIDATAVHTFAEPPIMGVKG